MRAILGLLVLAATCGGDSENCPLPKAKWSTGFAEKTWGLKIKNVKCTPGRSPTEYRVVLEFTKDVAYDDLRTIRRVFPPAGLPGPPTAPMSRRVPPQPDSDEKEKDKQKDKDTPVFVEFQFFDVDGVLFERCQNYAVEGEITGRTGDAFRVVMKYYDRAASRAGHTTQVSKVELRMPVIDKP
jgi:hypothetical protein